MIAPWVAKTFAAEIEVGGGRKFGQNFWNTSNPNLAEFTRLYGIHTSRGWTDRLFSLNLHRFHSCYSPLYSPMSSRIILLHFCSALDDDAISYLLYISFSHFVLKLTLFLPTLELTNVYPDGHAPWWPRNPSRPSSHLIRHFHAAFWSSRITKGRIKEKWNYFPSRFANMLALIGEGF